MRQLLLALALLAAATFSVLAAETPAVTTNSVTVDNQGVLQIAAPTDWTFEHTNTPDSQPYAALQSSNNLIAIEIWILWDGFGKTNSRPTPADLAQIVSNSCVRGYAKVSIEKKVVLEKLQGPAVSGTFARFSEAQWVPMLKGDYPNVASGMFRCGNLWGRFELLSYDKDGPLFKQGLQVLESMRRKP
jgi:hypothetical protein